MADEETGYFIVTCGNLVGKLHRDKFFCPGIHRECIEVDGHIVTPKMFSVMGDKEKLKDWKNACRINGVSFRKLMESGQLDFYMHSQTCTGRCMSRTPSFKAASGSDIIMTTEQVEGEAHSTITNVSVSGTSSITEQAYQVMPTKTKSRRSAADSQPIFPQPMMLHTSDGQSMQVLVPNGGDHHPAMFPQAIVIKHEEPDPDAVSQDSGHLSEASVTAATIPAENAYTYQENTAAGEANGYATDVMEDSEAFWKGILELGLMDDFFREIKSALDIFKNDMIRFRVKPEDARRMSRMVTELGMMPKLQWKLAAHKSETERQKEKLGHELEELKQKLARAEEREQAFKRKAECFDSLMEVSALKRPHREGSCEPAVQNDSSEDQARSSPKISSSEPVRGKAERLLNTVDLIRTRSQRDKSKRISTTPPVGENGNKVEEDENSSDTIPLEMEGDTKVKEEK